MDSLHTKNNVPFYQCERCQRIYGVDSFGVPDLQPVDRILDLPEEYLGLWALAQNASIDEYRSRSPASISSAEREITQAFSGYIGTPGDSVLDLGAGMDYQPAYLDGAKPRSYIALDPLAVERQVGFPRVKGWGEMLPFADNAFDAIVCATSLDHVLCLESTFEEIRRVLKPGGVMYVWACLFLEDTVLRNMPPHPLFLREGVATPLEDSTYESYSAQKKSLDSFLADANALAQFKHKMVDEYHFRHLPLNYISDACTRKNLSFQGLYVWDINHEEKYIHAFFKIANPDAKQLASSMQDNSSAYIASLYCKQEIRSLQSSMLTLVTMQEQLHSDVSTLEDIVKLRDIGNSVKIFYLLGKPFTYVFSLIDKPARRLFHLLRRVK